MYELLNIFIIRNRVVNLYIITTILLLISNMSLNAQELEVKPLVQSHVSPLLTNVYLYAAGSRMQHGTLRTANHTLYDKRDVYSKCIEVGATAEMYKRWLHYLGSLGYINELYSYGKGFMEGSGVRSHWISSDVGVFVGYLGAGVKSDIFMGSRVTNENKFSYKGINPSCFNRVSLCWYSSLAIAYTRLRAEARIGSYIVPHLNPQKIAYYNLTKTYVEGSYFEVRLSYRIFTSGRFYNGAMVF